MWKNVFNEHFMWNNEMSNEEMELFQTEIRCLQIARMQDFAPNTPGLLGALSGPRPPAVTAPRNARCATHFASRTPLHSFLPTGMTYPPPKKKNNNNSAIAPFCTNYTQKIIPKPLSNHN